VELLAFRRHVDHGSNSSHDKGRHSLVVLAPFGQIRSSGGPGSSIGGASSQAVDLSASLELKVALGELVERGLVLEEDLWPL